MDNKKKFTIDFTSKEIQETNKQIFQKKVSKKTKQGEKQLLFKKNEKPNFTISFD